MGCSNFPGFACCAIHTTLLKKYVILCRYAYYKEKQYLSTTIRIIVEMKLKPGSSKSILIQYVLNTQVQTGHFELWNA